jgi:uncharacterized protein (TIGR03000 family)
MKKFVVLAVFACLFTLAVAANPAHAQLLRRNRMRNNYDVAPAPMYVYTDSMPNTYITETGWQPTGYQTYTTPSPSRRLFARRARMNSNGGYYNGGYTYGPAPYTGVAYNGGPMMLDTTNTALATDTRRGNRQSFYSPAQSANQATIRVQLTDPNSRVTFEDATTTQTGRDRVYTSPPLDPSKSYTYTVRATWTEDGKEVTRTKDVKVQSGREATVNFREENDSK